jgi:hypothetical protein
MNLLAPLSAKLILGLSIALLASVTLNGLQAKSAWVAYGAAKEAAKAAPIKAENASLKQTAAVNDALSKVSVTQNQQLLGELTQIAERGQKVRVEYRNAARNKPLAAVCIPGQERMDTVNHGLGPKLEAP